MRDANAATHPPSCFTRWLRTARTLAARLFATPQQIFKCGI
jgi:hypothetical protein